MFRYEFRFFIAYLDLPHTFKYRTSIGRHQSHETELLFGVEVELILFVNVDFLTLEITHLVHVYLYKINYGNKKSNSEE